jgi:hypothetical protein
MNATSPLQKQDLNRVVALLEAILAELKALNALARDAQGEQP